MPSKKFAKTELQALLWDNSVELAVVQDTIGGKGRWTVQHDLIFRDVLTNQLYITAYDEGATEYQDQEPFEYEGDMIDCFEVEPVETVTTAYRMIKS